MTMMMMTMTMTMIVMMTMTMMMMMTMTMGKLQVAPGIHKSLLHVLHRSTRLYQHQNTEYSSSTTMHIAHIQHCTVCTVPTAQCAVGMHAEG